MTLEELKVIITAETSGLQSQLNNLQTQVSKVSTNVTRSTTAMSASITKAFKAIATSAAVIALYRFGKAAVDVSSDIYEVQNVVDVAFGDMAYMVDEFASTATEKFGLTTLQAKQFSSTFMAMSNGMGIVADEGKTMAIELTKLAADMASFYNVQQDVAFTSLKSVFTGETETLKKFGVVMTEANLEAYALSQGIKKSYKEMSQAEKVALRYQFVLNTTKNAQGDYARTSNSWANQMKLLSNQWTELKGIVGSFLVQVLTPMLIRLNQILAKVIQIGKALSSSFGKSSQASKGITESTEGAATNLGDANTQATKLKKTLAGFDELNVLEGQDTAADTGIDYSQFEMMDLTPIEESAEGILESTQGIKETLDNLKLPDLPGWVKAIGAALVAGGIIKILSWIMGGELFGMISKILGFLQGGILKLFGEGTWSGAFAEQLTVMKLQWDGFTGALSVGAGKIGTAMSTLLASPAAAIIAWVAVATAAVVAAYNKVDWFRKYVDDFWKNTLKPFFKDVSDMFKGLWNSGIKPFWDSIKELCSSVWGLVKELWEFVKNIFALLGVALGVAEGELLKGFLPVVKTVIATIVTVLQTALTVVTGVINTIKNVVNSLKQVFQGLNTFLTGVFTGDFKKAWQGIVTVFKGLINTLISVFEGFINLIPSGINGLITGINNVVGKVGNKIGINVKIPTLTTIKLPRLANGGVLTEPTAFIGGDAGTGNPEIVTPQKLLKETIDSSNSNLISAFAQMTRQVIAAIEEQDMTVSIGDDVIAKSAARGNNAYKRMTGVALI